MHQNFADWYRLLSIDPQIIPLANRWKGIETFIEDITYAKVFDLIRLSANKKPKDNNFDAEFRQAFKTHDDSFPMRQNDLEMELLATAAVVRLLNAENARTADLVALAVVCSDFQGTNTKPKIEEVLSISEAYLHKRSNSLRAQSGIVPAKFQKPKLIEFIKQVSEANAAWPSDAKTVASALDEGAKQMNTLLKAVNESASELMKRLELQQEETDILWWVFSEHSGDLRLRLSSIGVPGAALIAGKELADHVVNIPGPVAAEAFLDKVIGLASPRPRKKEFSLLETINSKALRTWKTENMNCNHWQDEDFCPLHYALRESSETSSKSTWVSNFEKKTGIGVSVQLTPLSFATQMYKECMLIKAAQ